MANSETKQTENQDQMNTKDFIIGALVGGIVGVATALFLAPKSGKELRHELNGQVGALKGKTDHIRISATQKGNELAAATKEKTIQLRNIAVEKGNQLAETVKEKKEKFRKEDIETKSQLED